MILISDGLFNKYLNAKSEFKLDQIINKPLYTVSDTPLTYRQVNSLDADHLLHTDRNDNSWRKFSLKELVYLLIVSELKKFGLKHDQLKKLWESFFRNPSGEIAIGCVFGQVEIILKIDSEGVSVFYDPIHSILFGNSGKPEISINLNNKVNHILEKTGREPFPIKWSVQSEVLDNPVMTVKEKEILRIIRNKSYSGISIKKKDGESYMVYAERDKKDENETRPEDIIKLLNEKNFQDISIIQRDGKIVNYKVEETYKL